MFATSGISRALDMWVDVYDISGACVRYPLSEDPPNALHVVSASERVQWSKTFVHVLNAGKCEFCVVIICRPSLLAQRWLMR